MSKHLKPQELSAHQDGMLAGMQRARAEAHLATCAECRAALERAQGLEHTLGEQLTQDPGEFYFRDFASRVEARIHPAGAPKLVSKAPPSDGFWAWLNTPVGMSWAGAAAVLVVGAGVALITVRTITPISIHAPRGDARTDQLLSAPPAATPPPGGSGALAQAESTAAEPQASAEPQAPPSAGANATAGGPVAEDQSADQRAESAPTRAVEMKPGPNGESIPVERRQAIAPAPAPSTPANLQSGVPVKVRKSATAQPLAAGAPAKDRATPSAKLATPPKQESGNAGSVSGREAEISPPNMRFGNAPAATNQRCGAVRDAGGHAVAGAQLMLVETGSNAQSHADGSFCLDVSAAAHTLVVMAVGFEAQRVTLDPADQGPLTLTLRAVSVVGGSPGGSSGTGVESVPGGSRWVQKPGGAPTSPSGSLDATKRTPTPVGSTESFASLSDSVRVLALKALQFENDAARSGSAEQYKLAGEEWQKVLKRTADTPAENETRFRVAAAYYRAWQIDPSHPRSVIALEAISSFVLRAPAGPERDQATMWLGHLRWGDTKAGDH
jgi:hypothetical protein